jgi:DNA polymerase-3 subunit beta
MHLVIDRANLLGELRLVASAAETRTTVPRLGRLRLEARADGVVQLTAQNLEYGLTSAVEAHVEEPGGICLPAKSFLQLVATLDGAITVDVDRNHCATITAGRSRSRMPGEVIDDFSQLEPMLEGSTGLTVDTLLRLVSYVSFAADREESRFGIKGALIRFTVDQLVCVATDGNRLALAWAPVAAAAPYEFLFPLAAMQSIQKLVEDQERVCMAASANHIFVAAGSRLLVASKLAGTFPDYERILGGLATSPVEMDASALRSALARVLPFADASLRLVLKVRFRLRPGELHLSATDAHGGEGEDSLECGYTGPEIAVSLNARYVREFLDLVPDGKVRAWFTSGKATEWRVVSDDAFRYLVMPLRD